MGARVRADFDAKGCEFDALFGRQQIDRLSAVGLVPLVGARFRARDDKRQRLDPARSQHVLGQADKVCIAVVEGQQDRTARQRRVRANISGELSRRDEGKPSPGQRVELLGKLFWRHAIGRQDRIVGLILDGVIAEDQETVGKRQPAAGAQCRPISERARARKETGNRSARSERGLEREIGDPDGEPGDQSGKQRNSGQWPIDEAGERPRETLPLEQLPGELRMLAHEMEVGRNRLARPLHELARSHHIHLAADRRRVVAHVVPREQPDAEIRVLVARTLARS